MCKMALPLSAVYDSSRLLAVYYSSLQSTTSLMLRSRFASLLLAYSVYSVYYSSPLLPLSAVYSSTRAHSTSLLYSFYDSRRAHCTSLLYP